MKMSQSIQIKIRSGVFSPIIVCRGTIDYIAFQQVGRCQGQMTVLLWERLENSILKLIEIYTKSN